MFYPLILLCLFALFYLLLKSLKYRFEWLTITDIFKFVISIDKKWEQRTKTRGNDESLGQMCKLILNRQTNRLYSMCGEVLSVSKDVSNLLLMKTNNRSAVLRVARDLIIWIEIINTLSWPARHFSSLVIISMMN